MSWFRYHTDALDNPKIQTLPAVLFRFWVNLLCVSKKVDGFLPESSEISFRCRVPEPQVKEWLEELKRRKLIDKSDDGIMFMHDWNEHQFVSDDVTARVRKHREKRKGNVSVTPSEQSRADNRAEHTQSSVRALPPVASDLNGHTSQRFEEFWARWPRQTGKDSAARAWCSYVSIELEADVFACLDRFLASGDVARGAIPNLGPAPNKPGWLADCARDSWKCRWPPAIEKQQPKKESRTQMLDRIIGS